MTDETIVNGYFYLTDGSISGDTITYTGSQKMVKIRAEKAVHDGIKPLMPFDMPKFNWDDVAETKFVDLKRIRQTKNIHGSLKTDGANTKEIKRNDLLSLCLAGGTVTLVWNTVAAGQLKYTVGLTKWKITEAGRLGIKKFTVFVECVVGTDLLIG